MLVTATTLTYFDMTKEICLHTNASTLGIRFVLRERSHDKGHVSSSNAEGLANDVLPVRSMHHPICLRDKLKDRMTSLHVQQGIIAPVTEPAE